MTTKRCVSWVAVSSQAQAHGASLDAQRKSNRVFIEETLPAIYGTQGITVAALSMADSRSIIELSDAEARYPESYGVLASMIRDGAFDILVCFTDDRLGRDPALIMIIRSLCRQQGIKIIESSGSLPPTLDAIETEGDNYTAGFSAVRSRNEILKLQERKRIGMAKKMDKGDLFPGRVPFGYRYHYDHNGNRSIVIDEDAAETVRYVLIDLYLDQGYGAPAICQRLNDAHCPAPEGGGWTNGSVQDIIRRAERYAGYIEWNKRSDRQYRRVRGNYEAIITDEEFDRIDAQRESRSHVRKIRGLSGIIICADCGQNMVYQTKYRSGDVVPVLQCRNTHCDNKYGRIKESFLIDRLTDVIVALPDRDPLDGFEGDQGVDITFAQGELDRLIAQRAKLERGRQRANRAFAVLETIDEAEYLRLISDIDEAVKEVNVKIADAEERVEAGADVTARADRLEEAKEIGATMMGMIYDEPRIVNQWLKQFIRVYCRHREAPEDTITGIDII